MQIKIRKYRLSDVDAMVEAVLESSQELSKWMSWCHPQYGHDDARAWIASRPDAWEKQQEWGFVIVDSFDRILGTCGIHRIDVRNGVGELGYWVRTSATRQNVATNASKMICDWAFREEGLERIEIIAAVANHISQRVAHKAGAIHEGTLRHRLLIHGELHDAELFAIIKQDEDRK